MKPLSAFFLLSFLFLFSSDLSDGRKDPAEYWKSIMKDEPMPKAIEELIVRHQQDQSFDHFSKDNQKKKTTNMDHFKLDFDTRPNAIIYHSHVHGTTHSEGRKSFLLPSKPGFNVPGLSN